MNIKKMFTILICFCLMFFACSCNRDEVNINGVKYQFAQDKFIVIGRSNNAKEIIIQDKIEDYEVSIIQINAFNGTDITKVVMPNTITNISGFTDCVYLKEVTLSENIKYIGADCFKGCTSLNKIVIKASIDNYLMIIESAFENCTALNDLTIENAKQIGDNAFKGCKSLKKVYLDKNLNFIGNGAFADCGDLEIYCEVTEKPEKWKEGWNGNAVVHWGCTIEDMNNA